MSCLALLLASVLCILQSVSGQTVTMSYVDVSSSLDTDSFIIDTMTDTILEPTATLSIMDITLVTLILVSLCFIITILVSQVLL